MCIRKIVCKYVLFSNIPVVTISKKVSKEIYIYTHTHTGVKFLHLSHIRTFIIERNIFNIGMNRLGKISLGKGTGQTSMPVPKYFYIWTIVAGSRCFVEFEDRGAGRWALQSRKVFHPFLFTRYKLLNEPTNINKIICSDAAKYNSSETPRFSCPMSISNLQFSDTHLLTSSAIS